MTTMLNEEKHARIIANKANLCRVANIPEWMLDKSAKEYCHGAELDWIIRFPQMRTASRGLVLTGQHVPPPEVKMMSMAAALVRNFVDARVITVQTLLDAHENSNEMPDPTVLFIPNLFVRSAGKGLPSWKLQIVYDALLHRYTEGKVSAVYVENLSAMAAEYGNALAQHIEAHYVVSVG